MPHLFSVAPVVAAADADAIIAAVIFVITIVSWLVNLLSNKGQKVPPVANRPRPPVRPRDEKLQEEISIFMQESAARKPGAARPAPPTRPGAAANDAARKRPSAPLPRKSARKQRPGAEIASRQAPVTETLGTGVKQHLNQYMADKVAPQVQQRLAPRVEEKLSQDLGVPVTTGTASLRPAPAGPALEAPRAELLSELLRNPASVRQAVVLNLVLSPPAARLASRRRGR